MLRGGPVQGDLGMLRTGGFQEQWKQPGANKGRQGFGEGNLPHTAPESVPFQAEAVPVLVQGGVLEIS